ncbi:MAG: hypothetical protein IBX50_12625 [Marinospirillum sp.]|uniref:hypothetical protein n=1 Tax=Marinospirillum sp. TaxID=2183934 RepID=UPI0019E2BC8E|nr:hypothetical protein [Marinospirillum sp.]MBE0507540.1 hypothetical protein [Marinospirillum sp.]
MNPDKLIDLVKSLFPDVGVFYSPADPEFPSSIPVVQFSAFDNAVTIDISDSLYSIYDYDVNDFDREVYISFNDPLHVLPYIYLWLDSGKAEPELPQYDEFCRHLTAVYHLLLAENSFEYAGEPERSDGFLRFWYEDLSGWNKCLSEPSHFAPGSIFISVLTRDIFEAVGGTEYDAAASFKLVGHLPHKFAGDYVDADGGYSS